MAKSALAASRIPTDWRSPELIEALPAAVYVCNAEAIVVAYNRRAAELWGREPTPGDTDEKYCGAHRLYQPDGTYMPHHETPLGLLISLIDADLDRKQERLRLGIRRLGQLFAAAW